MRESWLLLRLSPITQTSPGLTKKGPWYSGKPAGRAIVEREVRLVAEVLDEELALVPA